MDDYHEGACSEPDEPEFYCFEDYTPAPLAHEPEPRIYSNGFRRDLRQLHISSSPLSSVSAKELTRSRTVPSIPVDKFLSPDEIHQEYAASARKQCPSAHGYCSRSRPNRPKLLRTSDIAMSGARSKLGVLETLKGTTEWDLTGAAWTPDGAGEEEEYVLAQSMSPGLEMPFQKGTPQLFYTTPPKSQIPGTPGNEDRGRERGLGRLARLLSQKERKSSDVRKKIIRKRSASLDCGDRRRNAITLNPEELPLKCDGDSSSSTSPGLNASFNKSSPNLSAGRPSRKTSDGPRIRKGISEANLVDKGERKKRALMDVQALFDAIEHQDMDLVQYVVQNNGLDINCVNDDDFTPLDMAVMMNHIPMAKFLLAQGARENPRYQKAGESRLVKLIQLVTEAERRVEELRTETQALRGVISPSNQTKEQDKLLGHWESRHKLLRRMKTGYDHTQPPEPPVNVTLTVTSSASLLVQFEEPLCHNGAVVTQYRVEWSCYADFSPLAGEEILEDVRNTFYDIPHLVQGNRYYVRVRSWNIKGFGIPCVSEPACAIPSSWREIEDVKPRSEGRSKLLDDLFVSVKNARPPDAPELKGSGTTFISPMQQPSRSNMRKSIKKLFTSAPKFQKTLKRGVYLACLCYNEDKILVTNEDVLPILEVDDNFSGSNLHVDFHWLMKIACTWEDVKTLRQDMGKSNTSGTTLFRSRLLQAVAQLQSALGIQDLGRFYHKPVKDSAGSIIFITVNFIRDTKSVNTTHVKWTLLGKIQKRISNAPENLSTPDMLLNSMSEMTLYQRSSSSALSAGLYVGYLKLKSSVDLIRILVPDAAPNVVPFVKIRNCPNVSREEWEWIRNLSMNETQLPPSATQRHFQNSLIRASSQLLTNLGISEDESVSHRLYDLEVIELSDDVSFLLVLPPIASVCSIPGDHEEMTEKPGYRTLPVQVFEMIHMCTYQYSFITRYSRLSSILEVDMHLAQQAQRSAFSSEEIAAAKERVETLVRFQQTLDEAWKAMRWTMDIITYARDKNVRGGLPLSILSAPPQSPQTSPFFDRREVDSVASSDMGYRSDPGSGGSDVSSTEEVWRRADAQPGILRVYAAYPTGLAVGTSVKLHVTPRTTSREVIDLVVQQLNKAALMKGLSGPMYVDEQLEDFCLVAVIGARERVLREDYQPLQLQNPWTRGRLFVRLQVDKLAALELGHVTTV